MVHGKPPRVWPSMRNAVGLPCQRRSRYRHPRYLIAKQLSEVADAEVIVRHCEDAGRRRRSAKALVKTKQECLVALLVQMWNVERTASRHAELLSCHVLQIGRASCR